MASKKTSRSQQEVRVAFVGCGGIAAKHSRRMKDMAEVQIVGGCDLKEQIVEGLWQRTWQEETPTELPPAFVDTRNLYRECKPDAVVICSPHTLHFEQAKEALDAGCHVLLEKPMVTNADHARQLAAKVQQTGLVLAVAYNTPCTPEFGYLRQKIRDKALGRLELVSGWLVQNWEYLTTGSWRQDPALSGGGQAYDSGAHLLNSICWSVESNIAEVFAFVDNLDTPVDINSSINIRFDNGVFASVLIGGNCTEEGAHLTFAFENGRIDIDGWGGSWINVYKGRKRIKYPQIGSDPVEPADNFLDAVLGRADPLAGVANGIVHSELMDAIYESARTGRPARPSHG